MEKQQGPGRTRRFAAGVGKRLTYANLMATVATFGLLASGGAYAAGKIGPTDIARQAVHTKHIKGEAVKTQKLADGAVRSAKLRNGSVTPSKIAKDAPVVVDTLQNGWVRWDEGYEVAYWKDATGVVHLSGGVKDGEVSTDDGHAFAVFTLPEGFRPQRIQYQPVVSTTGGYESVPGGYVEVCDVAICGAENEGRVAVFGVDQRYVSLDGVTFRAK
jgi:hypothetical protein